MVSTLGLGVPHSYFIFPRHSLTFFSPFTSVFINLLSTISIHSQPRRLRVTILTLSGCVVAGDCEYWEMGSPENPNCNWVLDYGYLDDIPLPSLDNVPVPTNLTWSSSHPPTLSVGLDDSFGNSDGFRETGSRKRLRSGSCNPSGSKACREKMRRDRLNDRFLELGSILDPGRPPKMDKAVILSDAVRMVSQLREEALKLVESIENQQKRINELKAEKNELRDEKQRLKAEKDNLEQQLKALRSQPNFFHQPPALAAPFPAPGQVVGSKLVPFMGYPGVSLWQFLPPAAVDTSQDHVLRPPVA